MMLGAMFLFTNSGWKGLTMKAMPLILSCVILVGSVLAFAQESSKKAADFEGTTTTGKKASLAQFRGQVVLLDFWASWCKPCQEELPFLLELYRQNKEKGFVVLAINLDEHRTDMEEFLEKIHPRLNFPIITDPKGKIPTLYKIDRMPTTILIDQHGDIRYKQDGFQDSHKEELAKELQALLAGDGGELK